MADKVILNQAAIDAAIAYNAGLAQRQGVAAQTKAGLESQIAGAREYVSYVPRAEENARFLSAAGPDYIERRFIAEIPNVQKKGAELTSTVINPYEQALGVLGERPMAVPAPIYEEEDDKKRAGESAYALLLEQFSQYGLGALVEPLKSLIVEGLSPAEFTLRLRDTDAYKKRFAANQQRINRGLRALSEAEYIGLEDQYQNIMRNYGLPASYYARGDMGRQEGFEKFIGGDVSAAELEDRIQTAQNRVINAAPEVANALRSYYPDITNGDILAYSLDPDKAITEIRRKVTAAEIGAGAAMAGLTAGVSRAEELGRYGVTGEQARQGFRAVAEVAPRGGQLAEFYRQTPYTQTTAEQEVFGLTGATEAERQRKKLTQLEQAAFSGQAGAAGGAFARDRAGAF